MSQDEKEGVDGVEEPRPWAIDVPQGGDRVTIHLQQGLHRWAAREAAKVRPEALELQHAAVFENRVKALQVEGNPCGGTALCFSAALVTTATSRSSHGRALSDISLAKPEASRQASGPATC